MNEYFPTVVQVIPLDNYHVQVFFDDGKIVVGINKLADIINQILSENKSNGLTLEESSNILLSTFCSFSDLSK